MTNTSFYATLLIILSLVVSACGGGDSQQSASSSATAEPAAPSIYEVLIEGNDQMQYNKNRIEVTEGQTIQLTLKHAGQLPKEAMGHNWVLLKQGTDMVDFATKAIAAKDSDYIPAGEEGNIIAHTKMIGGGESTNIEFTAPGPGEYDFLCTFPGHYAMMKGKFVVKAK